VTEASLEDALVCLECACPAPAGAHYCSNCGKAFALKIDGATTQGFRQVSDAPQSLAHRSGRPPPSSAFPLHERATEPPHVADPLIGRVVADRYRIIEQIGRGGMGVVYRVEHARIGKLMALKLLTGELTRDGVQVARFKREALMASKLSHPNTVQVFDFGTADGLVYLAMEYLRGEDLGRIIRREGALSVERTAKIVIQIASSLSEAHEKGIVHRDLKPENILIVRGHAGEEVVKVLDFGLAKLRESSELSEVTSRGAIIGTPYYMSPEQIRGEGADPLSDVYSLGALSYACLTGEPVFDAHTPLGVFTKHLLEEPVAPQQRRPDLRIPDSVNRLILRTLAKDPVKRPASIVELRDALVDELRHEGANSVEQLLSSGELSKLTDDDDAAATRAEVERYEKKLRRRGYFALIAIGAVLATLLGLLAVALRPLLRPPAFTGREFEPNDSASQAQALPFGATISGRIGQRLDRQRSDRDFFVVRVPGGTRAVELVTTALPNLALCTFIYPKSSESPFGRYCPGAPGRDLLVPQLALPPGEYLLAVMQDQDAYTRSGPPPVYENVSDDYRLRLSAVSPNSGLELEPNDSPRNGSDVPAPGVLRGRLGFMRDVDVVCSKGEGALRFRVEEASDHPRPRAAVLEVKAQEGPDRDVPVRVHRTQQGFTRSPRDTVSPWRSAAIPSEGKSVCLELTLVPNPWADAPPPDVAPASDSEYLVHVETL
jgi:serine/threonine-protein kinase